MLVPLLIEEIRLREFIQFNLTQFYHHLIADYEISNHLSSLILLAPKLTFALYPFHESLKTFLPSPFYSFKYASLSAF